jgi:hypothetical protein
MKSTISALKQVFHWETLEADVREFVQQCIHCLGVKGSVKIPRPLGEGIHGDKPGDVLHMDYGHMFTLPKGGSEPRYQYIHILMDDCTNLIWLNAVEEPEASTTAESVEQWAATFGMPKVWVSDGGSHYKNQVMEALAHRYGATHHITLAYCPWSNGTIENMVGQVKKVFKMLLSEFRMKQEEWPLLLHMVQAALNSAPTEKLGGRSPIEAMTGVKPMTAINSIVHPETSEVCSWEQVSSKCKEALKELESARDQIHKEVSRSAKGKRDSQRKRFNETTKRKFPNLMEGDYVLVASTEKSAGNNLKVQWRGPRRITSIPSEWTYIVEDLLQGKRREVHVSRIKPYKDRDLNVTKELKEHVGHVEGTLEVERFDGVRKASAGQGWEIRVWWRGFEEADTTWEPLSEMVKDVPDMVRKYLTEKSDENGFPVSFTKSKDYISLTGQQRGSGKATKVKLSKSVPKSQKVGRKRRAQVE